VGRSGGIPGHASSFVTHILSRQGYCVCRSRSDWGHPCQRSIGEDLVDHGASGQSCQYCRHERRSLSLSGLTANSIYTCSQADHDNVSAFRPTTPQSGGSLCYLSIQPINSSIGGYSPLSLDNLPDVRDGCY
jgi:hypothetical protein